MNCVWTQNYNNKHKSIKQSYFLELKGYDYLVSKKEMVRRAFEVCGVVTTDPSKVRNDEFHVNIMKEVVDELKYWEAEEDDDPFAEETTTVKEI